jgi:hypothetical protein
MFLPGYISEFPKYSSVGGYPLVYYTRDNCKICADCAKEDHKQYVNDLLTTLCEWCILGDEGWSDAYCHDGKGNIDHTERIVVNYDANWEDENLICEDCNCKIESAYGDD